MNEGLQAGGIYIYVCKMGLVFWTSPLVSQGCTVGAVISGGILDTETPQAVKKIEKISGGGIETAEAVQALVHVPVKTYLEIKSLARMTLLCANHSLAQGSCLKAVPLPSLRSPEREQERALLAALRRGEAETAAKILREFLESLQNIYRDDFAALQSGAMELAAFLSRAGEISAEDPKRDLARIGQTKNLEELEETLRHMVDYLANQLFSFRGIRHAAALRKAERFIWENYTHKMRLQEIAAVAGLSAPYFSSVFKEERGENLSTYLNRLRVEKAALLLRESDLPIQQIAGASGFEDQSWFSKIFKQHIGISPGKFRGERHE
jgi:AraC-like DNA-binding protein